MIKLIDRAENMMGYPDFISYIKTSIVKAAVSYRNTQLNMS